MAVHVLHLDADIYLPAVLDGFPGSRPWMAPRTGKTGGMATSEAKAAAARRYGKLGGRPRKIPECA